MNLTLIGVSLLEAALLFFVMLAMVYGISWIVATAWFQAKRQHTDQLIRRLDSGEERKQQNGPE